MSEPTPFTQADLARHYGWDRSYVTKMKKKGMPVTSVEEAEKWMQERAIKIGSRTKLQGDEESSPEGEESPLDGDRPKTDIPGKSSPPADDEPDEPIEVDLPGQAGVSLVGLERALRDSREVLAKAKKMVAHAQKHKLDQLLPQRIANFTSALKEYGRMEEWVRKERERREELMTVAQHKIQLNKLWIPMITNLRKMPRVLAMKVAPNDDVHAEKQISLEVENVIAEGRRSLQSPPDIDFHLNVWLLGILTEEGGKNAIERLDFLRARVVAAMAQAPVAATVSDGDVDPAP